MSSDLDTVGAQHGVELATGLVAELEDYFNQATVVLAGEYFA